MTTKKDFEEKKKEEKVHPKPKEKPIVVKAKPIAVEPVRELPKIALKVWCSASGKKPDQLAGFVLWAKKEKLNAMTIPEWWDVYQKFMDMPARG